MTKPAKPLRIKLRRLPHAEGLSLPAYQTADAAGLDLVAAIAEGAPVVIVPGARAVIPTGLILELPAGTEAQIRPRSGLAAKHGVTVLNSPGTIDADYRGEISVILINHGDKPFTIGRGDRIAQMILAPVTQAQLLAARTLSRTRRGAGGFGSTGIADAKELKNPPKRNPVAPRGKSVKSRSQKPRANAPRIGPQR